MTAALPVVDGFQLPEELRELLRPGATIRDYNGRSHILPRFFYCIADWNLAKTTKLAPHFSVAEMMLVDCREADPLLLNFPHYIPCGVSLFARYLEEFRQRVGAPVSISVNGGYRSPRHAFSTAASAHLWGTAANIYRIGDTYLDTQKCIEKYSAIAQEIGQEVCAKPFGAGAGQTDDHLHIDIGYAHWIPREADEVPGVSESSPG